MTESTQLESSRESDSTNFQQSLCEIDTLLFKKKNTEKWYLNFLRARINEVFKGVTGTHHKSLPKKKKTVYQFLSTENSSLHKETFF